MRLPIKFSVISALLVGCIHTNSSETKKKEPEIELPSWVNQDCHLSNGYYYFVGYGEGQNASSAVRNALITSRQNALTCLFGGTVTSKITVDETNESIDFSGRTSVTLSYQHVNWSGYEQVSGKVVYAAKERNKLYSQYRWPIKAIEQEQTRLRKLAEKIEETNALKGEVEIKKEIIEEQQEKLAELNRQEEQLRKLKKQSDVAVAKLRKLNDARNEKERDIVNVVNHLYCGITVDQFIEIFRAPDREIITGSSGQQAGYVSSAEFYWDQFLIKIHLSKSEIARVTGVSYTKVGEEDNALLNWARTKTFTFVYVDYGKTNRGYNICKSS